MTKTKKTIKNKPLHPDWTLDPHYDGFSLTYNHSDEMTLTWVPDEKLWRIAECQMEFGSPIPWKEEETLRDILDQASRQAEAWFAYWAAQETSRPSDPAISRK